MQVTSSNTSIKVKTAPANATFCLQILPVRPTIVATSPDNFEESSLGQTNGVPFELMDGGYFGAADSPTIAANFDGQALLPNNSVSNTPVLSPRRISSFLPPATTSGHFAGLFPVSVTYTTTPPPPFTAPNPASAFSNMAVIPDYGGANPPVDLTNNPLTLKPVSQPPPPNPPKILPKFCTPRHSAAPGALNATGLCAPCPIGFFCPRLRPQQHCAGPNRRLGCRDFGGREHEQRSIH